MNKKLLALLLAILMVAMSAVAMAEDAATATATLTGLTKNFTTDFSTKTGISRLPSETLNFTADATGLTLPDGTSGTYTNAPQLTGSIAPSDLNNSEAAPNTYTGTFSIATTASWPSAGIYTYKAKETKSNIQGVTYSEDEIIFEVLVSYVKTENADGTTSQSLQVTDIGLPKDTEGKKNGTFTNEYESGSVKVSKAVDGNAADATEYFTVQLTFAAGSNKALSESFTTVTVGDEVKTLSENKTIDITVKHGDTVTISDIPLGASVTALEKGNNVDTSKKDPTKYWPTYKVGETETPTATATAADTNVPTIAITNYRSSSIATGVTTDSMPYILLMAFVAILAVAFVAKKRTVKE